MQVLFSWLNDRPIGDGPPLVGSDRRLLVGALRLASAFAAAHPRWYSRGRVPLARFSNHPDEELAARAREELDRLRRAFSSWVGPNLRLAIDPDTGAEYGWRDVVEFSKEVAERPREILLRALSETTLVRSSVFLFYKGALLSLADLQPHGATVSLLGGSGGKSVYRLTLQTRGKDTFEVAMNLSEQMHPMELLEEMEWMLAVGGDPPLVEAYGGHFPEYGVFTEEYIAGEHVAEQIARLVLSGETKRMKHLWRFLAQTAFGCHALFWERTGRRLALALPVPEAFIIPSHDYQGGARLVSISRRSPCTSLDELIGRFQTHFLEALVKRYPDLAGEVDEAMLLEALVEVLGAARAVSALEQGHSGPRAAICAQVLEQVRTLGHTPLRVTYAARRYRRWLLVNPGATLEARGTMLGELWTTYRLAEVEKTAPDTRIRFFRHTVFAEARPQLISELERLMGWARTTPIGNLDVLGEVLAGHRAAVEPNPEEDYFLARMTYRYLKPSDEAQLVSIPWGEKKVASVMMGMRDRAGGRYFVRRPATPREVARLLQLFHDANLAVTFMADDDYLLAIDTRDVVIAGLFWRWLQPGEAYMEKVVVARSHRGLGIGEALVREEMRRLRARGAHSLSTGYFKADYFKRLGFRTDPKSGGLVVDLEGADAPRTDDAAEAR
jgi:GNAT superfamily N-acetyltransferase